MVSTSSKTLPFISLAIGLALAIAAILGYDKAIEALVAILPIIGITAGGGLINKKIEASMISGVAQYKTLLEDPNLRVLIEEIVTRAKNKATD